MKILIIEDNTSKAQDVKRCLEDHYTEVKIDMAAAYASGVRKAYRNNYDVVIIDNSLPYYESEPYDIQPDMAEIILEEFSDLEIAPKTIVCSAFESGEKEEYFQRVVSRRYFCIGFVRYDCTSSEWEEKLINLIESINH